MSHEQIHAAVDRRIATALEHHRVHSSCRNGCFHCCYEPVWASDSEADYIIDSLSEEEKALVTAATAVWVERTAKMMDYTDKTMNVLDYRLQEAACPLLKDGKCSVYSKRPIGCRAHIAAGPPEHCASHAHRLRQKFVTIPTVVAESSAALLTEALAKGAVEFDHLGVLLAKKLLGLDIKSAGHLTFRAEKSNPKPPRPPAVKQLPSPKAGAPVRITGTLDMEPED